MLAAREEKKSRRWINCLTKIADLGGTKPTQMHISLYRHNTLNTCRRWMKILSHTFTIHRTAQDTQTWNKKKGKLRKETANIVERKRKEFKVKRVKRKSEEFNELLGFAVYVCFSAATIAYTLWCHKLTQQCQTCFVSYLNENFSQEVDAIINPSSLFVVLADERVAATHTDRHQRLVHGLWQCSRRSQNSARYTERQADDGRIAGHNSNKSRAQLQPNIRWRLHARLTFRWYENWRWV